MGPSTDTMAALVIPLMAILILLHNPTGCDAITSSTQLVNETTAKWCEGHHGKCLVGEANIDSEFLVDSEISRMLIDFNNFNTGGTNNANRPAVPDCNRPPRYDSCLGEKRSTPPPGNCGTYNREHPC